MEPDIANASSSPIDAKTAEAATPPDFISKVDQALEMFSRYTETIKKLGLESKPDNTDTLEFSDVKLSDFDLEVIFCYIKQKNWKIKTIKFFNIGLKMFPRQIFQLKDLETLHLIENMIEMIPDEIGELIQLKNLTISGYYSRSPLKSLPETIGKLINLETLNVRTNRLTSLPDSLGRLVNLKVLDIGNNNIRTFPSWIKNLTQLKEFIFDENGMTIHEDDLMSLPPLRNFDFAEGNTIVTDGLVLRKPLAPGSLIIDNDFPKFNFDVYGDYDFYYKSCYYSAYYIIENYIYSTFERMKGGLINAGLKPEEAEEIINNIKENQNF